MSRDREAARALNSLARDGLALLGTSDGSALTDFLHEFFAGEDPGNESPGMIRLKPLTTLYQIPNDL